MTNIEPNAEPRNVTTQAIGPSPQYAADSHSEKLLQILAATETTEQAMLRLQFELSRQLHMIKWILLWVLIIVPVLAAIAIPILAVASDGASAPDDTILSY